LGAAGRRSRRGRSYERAAIRELEEETGAEVSGVGPQIWSRERDLIHDGELKRHLERYFIAWAKPPQTLRNRTQENIEEIRWWTLNELRASTETFLPEDFVELVALVIAGDVPSVPIDIHLRQRK
jgi:ADP-ribose pyrophosphatase YjhB (NUDIX family)